MMKPTLSQDLALVKEVIACGKNLIVENRLGELDDLLQNLKSLIIKIEHFLAQEKGALIPRAITFCHNFCASIDDFHAHPTLRARIFRMDIVNISWNLTETLHRQYDILNHPEHHASYRDNLFTAMQKAHDRIGKTPYKYRASIFLVAYNKLEYTKIAIESIYKYTDFSRGDIELIVLDNGSSDGTREYFESLPIEKKLFHKENAFGVPLCPEIYEGEYQIGFSNDVVATPNWLENILTCMDSDKRIGMVVPTCGEFSISCQQGIPVNYPNTFEGMPAMLEFATTYNKSNPALWEERALLMPFVCAVRHELLDIGFVDCLYTKMEFVDDDLSTTLRRTGWRQILAKDTYLHHFGSVTLGEMRLSQENNSLEAMRHVYFEKWGVDAWDSRTLPIFPLEKYLPLKKNPSLLWLEPMFGVSFLSARYQLQASGKSIAHSVALLRESKYLADAKPYFDEIIETTSYLEALDTDSRQYDLISMGRYFNDLIEYDPLPFIEKLYEKLAPGGCLVLFLENRQSFSTLTKLLFRDGEIFFESPTKPAKFLNVLALFNRLNNEIYPDACHAHAVLYNLGDNIPRLIQALKAAGFSADFEHLSQTLSYNDFWIFIQKPQSFTIS